MKASNVRKFKFGGVWAVTTVAIIAVIIALNAVFSALSSKYALYLDLTKAQYYDISEVTDELLKDIDDEIDIIFCTPLDQLSDNTYSAMIYTLAKNYAAKYDNIDIEYLDWRTDTERANNYKMRMADASIDDTTIIVDCPGKAARRLTWDSMLVYDSDQILYGFKGELQFTSAILQITGDRPIVAFTANHSENMEEANALIQLFEYAGYEVIDNLNLSTDNIPEGTSILVSYNPKNDFIATADGVNEFDKINEFTANNGHLMVFLSSTKRTDLPELYSYLKEEWYVNVEYGVVKDSTEHSLSIHRTNIAATFGDEGPAASLTKHILESNESTPTVSVENSVGLSIDVGGDNSNNELFVSHVLTTSENGELYRGETLEKSGTIGLMTLACRETIIDNETLRNYVLVSGSSDFASYDNLELGINKYANSDILYAAMHAMGRDIVPDEIDIKEFDDASLDLTVEQANNWTMVFAVVIPTVLMIAGIVVYLRRKHL